MKTLIATTVLLASSTAYAHDNCDVDIHGGIKISPTAISFYQHKNELYSIHADQQLWIKGEQISLTEQQQSLVTDYASQIRHLIPEIRSVALDGIDIAMEGVGLAFDELLGKNNDAGSKITEQLSIIKQEIAYRFDQEQTIYFDENGIDGGDFLGKDFENRLESVIEQAVKESMGSLLIAVGQQMLFSGGDMDAFEAKMEKFGEQMEHKMEAKGEKIVFRAEQLCQAVVKIDRLEQQIGQQFKPLAEVNVISTKYHAQSM
jgi:hypothetical protein